MIHSFIILIMMICEPRGEVVYEGQKVKVADKTSTSVWSALSWRGRLRVLTRIALAPKLIYRLERMEVYRDGVWVDYSVTNLSSTRKFVTPWFLDPPVAGMEAWDADRHKWQIPQFQGNVSRNAPDTFVSMQPGGSIRYRSQMSPLVNKPLEPVERRGGRKTDRPKMLDYRIIGWSYVYTRLSEGGAERVNAYVIGLGKVPVRWHDEESPKSWKPYTRLYGSDK